jgi:hypothetical protein
MTTESGTESTTPAKPPAVDPADIPHPLSTAVKGRLRIHFENGGGVVERACSQYDARAFLAQQQKDQATDLVDWDTPAWFSWKASKVVFSSFDADRDQNWNIAPEDRERLAKAGHRHGVVRSLVDFWERQERGDEPAYSIAALVALHFLALDGVERWVWESAARVYEGERGAALMARLNRKADKASSQARGTDEQVDDHAEPEAGPDASSDGGIDDDGASQDGGEATASESTDESWSEEAEEAEE